MFVIPIALSVLLELVPWPLLCSPFLCSIPLLLFAGSQLSLTVSVSLFSALELSPHTVLRPALAIKISIFSAHTADFNKGFREKLFIPMQWKKALDSESGSKGSHPAPAVGWVTWCKWFSNSGQLVWRQGNWSKTGILTYWHYWFLGLIILCC